MSDFDKSSYGITGVISLLAGGSLFGLSKMNKLSDKKKPMLIIGVLLTGIGLIFTSLFADANLYPEKEEEEEE